MRLETTASPVMAFAAALMVLLVRPAMAQNAFPRDYTDTYAGGHVYEVVPGVELAMILTAVAYRDADIRFHPVRRDTEYYHRVLAHFSSYADHPVFAALSLNPDDLRSYTDLRNNGYNWVFCGDQLCRQAFLGKWWQGEEFLDTFSRNIDLINEFARVTDFRAFFEAEKPYYARLAALYEERIDLPHMIAWLYSNFPYSYDSYRILFSPLILGNQSTTIKRAQAFTQVFAIVDPPSERQSDADALLRFRWVFTELDHQYVEPAAERHAARIDSVFADRSYWTTDGESAHYGTPFRVFAEYMTWAVYLVYLEETYEPEVAGEVKGRLVRWVEERRGFPRFGVFYRTLSELRRATSRPLYLLLPPLLDWAQGTRE